MSAPFDDLLHVESALWVATREVGEPIYDFHFDRFFACRRPYDRPETVTAVARIGAAQDYAALYQQCLTFGVRLIHTPEQQRLATELPRWYPLIEPLTARSLWFDGPPDIKRVAQELGWPIFMKGTRQTSRHKKSLSIIRDAEAMETALREYARDPVLHWQGVVCRQLLPLRIIDDSWPDRLPSAFEFRSFWWHGELVGLGRYWWQGPDYKLTPRERDEALEVGQEAAKRVPVPFLVIDLAQTVDGRWVVIECNDGQESGYAGVSAVGLWNAILARERTSKPS